MCAWLLIVFDHRDLPATSGMVGGRLFWRVLVVGPADVEWGSGGGGGRAPETTPFDQDALDALEELEINVHYFVDSLDMHYEQTETCTIAEIMQLLIDSQGGRDPKLKDLVNLHNFSRWSLKTELRKAVSLLHEMNSNSTQRIPPQAILPHALPQNGTVLNPRNYCEMVNLKSDTVYGI